MRIGIAARLSQKRQGQTGIETQDTGVLRWADREGHEVVFIAADHKSGTVPPWKRPNLKPWVTDPTKIAQYDAIVAYKFDRLSRGDDASTAEIEKWARENGKLLITVSEDLQYPCEGLAGIRWDLAARMAHQEWLETSRRYRDMGGTIREGGFHYGRAPYGYQSVKAPGSERKTLVQVPAEAEVIRDAAAWYLGGASLGDICERLTAQGRLPRMMKNGRQPLWAPSTLSKVLHNEVIAGRQKNTSGTKTVQKVEPILSRDIWEAVIARLAERTKRTAVSQAKAPALLTSVLFCAGCDKPMYRSGTERNRYYHCKTKGCRSTIRVDVADAWMHELMNADHDRDILEVVVPGSGHEVDIADVKRDLAEAVEAEDFDRLPALRAELERLRALPASPTRVERLESDKTVAEMWAEMPGDVERRAYLMERGVRATYHTDEDGKTWLMCNARQAQSL